MKQSILSYDVNENSIEEIVDLITKDLIHSKSEEPPQKPKSLFCFNPHSYYISCSDNVFSNALRSSEYLIPDGIGVLFASIILGKNIEARVTGSDVFLGVHDRINNEKNYSVFFLGSSDANLKKIRERMANDYPNISVAGTYSPSYKDQYTDDELDDMIKIINKSKVDVLWVGMTAPKQEKWIYQNLDRLNVKFIAAVGAVFDFYTGNVMRSPLIFQRLGLEWLPRLVQQPKRLWRRMFISAPFFLWHVLLEKFRSN
jgi:N-acetylglucosaminyldiphosphoundecaprenol N-acetyl-beta-D-mannosaminyltransferase